MTRYKDTDKLIEEIKKYHDGLKPKYISKLADAEILDIIDIINEQPTADVAEVVHGEWIHKGTSNGKKIFECSNCKSSIAGSGRFCKECGAKMDEKRAE